MTFSEYVKNKEAHQRASYHISDGTGYVMFEGTRYTDQEFDKAFDLSTILKQDVKKELIKGNNSDKTKSWMY